MLKPVSMLQSQRCPRPARALVISFGLVLLCLVVYWPVTDFDFVNWDDDTYVVKNPNVNRGLSWGAVRWAFDGLGYQGNADPLTWLSHMLDVQLFGLRPSGHHVTSLVFHAMNASILFLVFFRMTSALWKSAFVAALFAVHPLHVESVAWISERKNVLSTFFGLLSVASYLRYAAKPGLGRYLAVLALFSLGLLSKPMLVTLPGVLLLLDYWPLGRLVSVRAPLGLPQVSHAPRIMAQPILDKIPLLCLSGAAAALAYIAQVRGGTVASVQDVPVGLRMANSLVAFLGYLSKMALPRGLAFFYPFPELGIPVWKSLAAMAVLVLVSAVGLWRWRTQPYLIVGWAWYLGTLLPVSGLVQIGSFSMADRFAYLPLLGVFIMVSWGLASTLQVRGGRRVSCAVLGVTALLLLAVIARRQSLTWRNDFTLFGHAIAVTTDNWLAHNTLALSLAESGRPQEAIRHYEESLRIRPTYSSAHNNLGQVLLRLGKTEQAVQHFEAAVRYGPDVELYRSNLKFAKFMATRLGRREGGR